MARVSRKKNQIQPKVSQESANKIYRAGIYVRISVENERKIEADSIGNQIQLVKDFASQMDDIVIHDIYCDDGITGTTFIRPEFSRMMNDVRDHNINCIIVKDLSRLGRNTLESGEYLEKVFPFFGIRFIAINDRIDTIEKEIGLDTQIKNMANEMYARDISKKIRSSVKILKEQGKFVGSQPPYGYMRHPDDKYALMIDPETAPVVVEIFQRMIQGQTIHAITLELNERGIPSPGRYKFDKGLVKNEKFQKSIWFFPTIRRILSDTIYLGWIQYGKYQSHFQEGGSRNVQIPKEEWKTIKGVHDPIISEEIFSEVQQILAKNKKESCNAGRYHSKHNKNNLFRGKLRCGECGKSMALSEKESHGKKQMRYICPIHEHYSSSYCSKKSVQKNKLDQLVLSTIRVQMQLYLDAEQLIRSLNAKSAGKSKFNMYQNQIKDAEKRLEHYMELKSSAYQDFAEKTINREDYVMLSERYSKKVDELKIFISQLTKELQKYNENYCGSLKWAERINAYKNQEELSRDMVECFIDKIILYNDDRVEIEFNQRTELETVLYLASTRKEEDMRYAM